MATDEENYHTDMKKKSPNPENRIPARGSADYHIPVSLNHPITVLVDGPDLCGKTTIVHLLCEELSARGLRVACCKGLVKPTVFHRWLSKFDANRSHSSGLLNTLYLISAFLDRAQHGDGQHDILICESHVDRVIAYGLAFRLRSLAKLALYLRPLYRRFDIRVLLTASYQTRLHRLLSRDNPTHIDRKTTASKAVSDRFSRYFQATYQSKECITIHSDTSSKESIVEEIVGRINSLVLDRISRNVGHGHAGSQ